MKKVTIQEAIKANEHSRVKLVENTGWFQVGEILKMDCLFRSKAILAEWEIEAKPLEVWVNVYEDNTLIAHKTKDQADLYRVGYISRCVKMREVVE